jgi:hypothetical protein
MVPSGEWGHVVHPVTIPSPRLLDQDVYNHNLWRHDIKGEVDADQADQAAPDRTLGFYAKYKRPSGQQRQRAAQESQRQPK